MVTTKKLARDSVIYSASEILTRAIGIILIPLFTRVFSTDEYGVYSATMAVMQIFVILFGLGLGSYIIRGYFECSRIQERRRFTGTIFAALLICSLVLSLVVDRLGSSIFSHIFDNVPFRPFLRYTVWIAFLKVFFIAVLMLFIAKGESLKVSFLSIFNSLLVIGLILYFVLYSHQGVEGSLKGYFFGFVVFFLVSLFAIRKDVSLRVQLRHLKPAFYFSLPLVPHALAGWVINLADRILVERFCGVAALGLYTLGYQMGMILDLINNAINKAWVPFFYSAAEENDAPQRLRHIALVYFGISLSIGLSIALFGREVIALVSDPKYLEAHRVIPFISAAAVFHGFYYLTSVSIFYRKKTNLIPLLTGLVGAINILLNLKWLPMFGYMGAAYATTVSFFILCLLSYIVGGRMYAIKFPLGKIVTISLVAVLIFRISQFTMDYPLLLSLLLKFMFLAGFLVLLLAMKIFTIKDLQTIKILLRLREQR